MSDFLTKQKVLLALLEAGYASGSVPQASDAIEASEITLNLPGEILERNLQNDDLSPESPLMGSRYAEITFVCELKGSGAAGTPPALSPLLQACGFLETINAGVSVVYTPTSTSIKSTRLYYYDFNTNTGNSRLFNLEGARGSFDIILEAGMRPLINFTFQAIYEEPTGVANPSPSYGETTKPPIVEELAFAINSETTLVVQSLTIDMANELVRNASINAVAGVSGITIVGRKPVGTFNPEAVLIATENFFADWAAGTQRAMSAVVGDVAGNICTIGTPKVTYDTISSGDRNGIRIDDIPIHFGRDSGSDEITLTFT